MLINNFMTLLCHEHFLQHALHLLGYKLDERGITVDKEASIPTAGTRQPSV